ncbi:hypothetical protein SEA_WALTZ_34 [Arthrobacter phage Waltz]|nr:hypothetical protein SEA_WALTZ_34 [Arthrobacter phage Waltz]
MPLRPAIIESNGTGRGKVIVDGMDLSEAVGRVEFTSQPGDVDRLILTTNVAARLDTEGAEVRVDDKTRLALICLGWTPPAVDPDACPLTPHDCGGEDRPRDRVADPEGFHNPTLRGALDAYLDSLPGKYSPVVKGIRALMSYYPLPQQSDPVTCRCFTG